MKLSEYLGLLAFSYPAWLGAPIDLSVHVSVVTHTEYDLMLNLRRWSDKLANLKENPVLGKLSDLWIRMIVRDPKPCYLWESSVLSKSSSFGVNLGSNSSCYFTGQVNLSSLWLLSIALNGDDESAHFIVPLWELWKIMHPNCRDHLAYSKQIMEDREKQGLQAW